ncbi:MAG: efflux RND transporter periplasmic adaptor subunit [Fidelibacterota bacterium]|nr:MAG: efflux RND transporter periplasmic adaptor subunit [Candidatus Neomarinimicrobiota bacterium]
MRLRESRLKLTLLLVTTLLYVGCSANAKPTTEEEKVEAALPVEVKTVQLGMIAAHFTGPVTLETEEDAQVVAKTSGVVKEIFAEEGQAVKKGQLLAKLEDERQSFELARTKASLQKLEKEYQRNKELFAKNLISAEVYDRTRFEYDAQKAAYELAKLEMVYTSIKAPIGGVVAERLIKAGNMVAVNAPTFRVIDFNTLKAVLHVPEIELDKLRPNQLATLKVDALPGNEYSGQVSLISPVIDPATGTIKVTIAFDNADRILKPGMFGRVSIMHDIHPDAVLLPKEALLAEDQEATVFVVYDSVAIRQPVRLGLVNTIHYEVLGGIEEGDVVVTTGQAGLKDSARVEIVTY